MSLKPLVNSYAKETQGMVGHSHDGLSRVRFPRRALGNAGNCHDENPAKHTKNQPV